MRLSRKSIFLSGAFVGTFLGFFWLAYKYSDLKGLKRFVLSVQIAGLLTLASFGSTATAKDTGFLPGAEGFPPPLARPAPSSHGHFGSKTASSNSGSPKKGPGSGSTSSSCRNPGQKKQCDLIEIESKIKDDPGLVKYAEKAGKNQDVQRDINDLIEKLRLGNENPGKGTKTLFKNIKEARGENGGRVYFRKKNGKIQILGKSSKVKKDQNGVIKILRKKYT